MAKGNSRMRGNNEKEGWHRGRRVVTYWIQRMWMSIVFFFFFWLAMSPCHQIKLIRLFWPLHSASVNNTNPSSRDSEKNYGCGTMEVMLLLCVGFSMVSCYCKPPISPRTLPQIILLFFLSFSVCLFSTLLSLLKACQDHVTPRSPFLFMPCRFFVWK